MAKILVVEDNQANMRFVTFLLESVGHTPIVADDAETGLAMARTMSPDLVLMDIHLPGIDGLEATRQLKADAATRGIPVVALTALAMAGDEARMLAAGCDGYIAKPIRYAAFLATLERHLLPNAAPGAPLTRARVLVVDDESSARDVLYGMLDGEFAVRLASSGEEALALVHGEQPDVVLLDVVMPDMDGFQVAARLKQSAATSHIPILLVTSMDDRATRILGLSAGADDFIAKPIHHEELCVRVRKLVRLKSYADYREQHRHLLEGEVGLRTTELIDSQGLYRSMFDLAPVGIAHVGVTGRFIEVNARLCSKLGYTAEQLQRMTMQELLDPEDVAGHAPAFAALAKGTVAHHSVEEMRYRCADGTFLWGRLTVSAHRNSEGQFQHFIATIQDVTQRRSLEAQMRQASRMDALGQLAAGVAHDFNNILSVVLSYADLLSDGLAPGDPVRADLAAISAAGAQGVGLTRQLLAMSRQQLLRPRVVDLSTVVAGMDKVLGRLLGEHVDLSTILGEGLGMVLVDTSQVEQVVMNLAINARDAMPRGGKLTIETSEVDLDEAYAATHVAVTPGRHVMLAVSDFGTGMDKATQARMFEPFFTTKELGKGTGLGLATVFGIVRQSGGTVWVYSELGVGTTFKVYFPITELASGASPTSVQPSDLQGREAILVVEDDVGVRAVIRTILQRYGYEVIDAAGPGDALLFSEQHRAPIHLLLTDLVMPRMGGPELAKRLVALRPEMRVLYMSGYAEGSVVRHGVLESRVAFLQKPITPEALAIKVRAVLDGARSIRVGPEDDN